MSPRYFASSSSSPSADSDLRLSQASGVDLNDEQLMKELKSMGIEMNSDPLDVRLQVHPSMTVKDAEDVFHRFLSLNRFTGFDV